MSPLILAGAFLGWGLGANDSSNIFGTAVYTRVIRYSTAVVLTAIFVILGAVVDGSKGIVNLSNFAFSGGVDTKFSAFTVVLAAAITVLVMTLLKLSVSTSQAVIGAIIGAGILKGKADLSRLFEFFSAWIVTPIGALGISFILYSITHKLLSDKLTQFKFYEWFIRIGYLVAGILGAYSLGANNVANVAAVFSGQVGVLSVKEAAWLGGISIALGVLTYSKPVMSTVGEKIMPLTPVAGFIVVVASSITVYIFAKIGIPISTSQALIGAIIGIGIKMGAKTLRLKVIRNLVIGWVGTPAISAVISMLLGLLIS